jgi:predicted transcriptional regulator
MASAKQVARHLLETLPEDCTLEEISYHLYAQAKAEEGLRDLDADRANSHEQVMREAAEWLRNRRPGCTRVSGRSSSAAIG